MTLSYTTAQKLKEHNYPFKKTGNVYYMDGLEKLVIPSLEELIEACGDGISGLVRGWDGKWWAANAQDQTEPQDTPLKAVAELYCALNPKGV
jgi:hypothetical protein